MLAYTYIEHGKFELIEKPKPGLKAPRARNSYPSHGSKL